MRQRFDALHSTLSRAFARLKPPKRAATINQPVEISELLGRKPVNLDTPELCSVSSPARCYSSPLPAEASARKSAAKPCDSVPPG